MGRGLKHLSGGRRMCKRPFSVKRCAYIILHGEAQNIQIKGQKKGGGGSHLQSEAGSFFSFLSITSKSTDSECTTSTTTTTAAAVARAESPPPGP